MFAQRYNPDSVQNVSRAPLKRRRDPVESDSDSDSDSNLENNNDDDDDNDDNDDDDESSLVNGIEPEMVEDVDMTNSSNSSDSDSDSDLESLDETSDAIDNRKDVNMDHSEALDDSDQVDSNMTQNNSKVTLSQGHLSSNNNNKIQLPPTDLEAADDHYISRHTSIFSKLQKVSRRANKLENEPTDDKSTQMSDDEHPTHALAPLPQPQLPRDRRLKTIQSHTLDWLAKPIYIDPELTQPFESLGIPPFLVNNLHKNGFVEAFSVQVAVLNTIKDDYDPSKGRSRDSPGSPGDILVNASTGSGKTLAYLVPIVAQLHRRVVPRVRAIILVPTKPLINQVSSTLRQLASGTSLSMVVLKNELSVRSEAEKLLSNEPDIIISTPGRLVEHLNNGSVSLKALEFLIIDEADRLLNQSFQDWASIITQKLPILASPADSFSRTVQKFIFSATLTTDAGKLAVLDFYRPRLLVVNLQQQLVNEAFLLPSRLVEHKVVFGSAKASSKPLILLRYLAGRSLLSNVLLFTKSNEASLRLSALLNIIASKLQLKVTAAYLNSTNNTALSRAKIFKQFHTGEIGILVGTDLVARGLDLPFISTVVNYDLPNSSREYVHRVGRTARANQSGSVYSFCFGRGESKWFAQLTLGVSRLQELVQEDNPVELSAGDEDAYKNSLATLQEMVREN